MDTMRVTWGVALVAALLTTGTAIVHGDGAVRRDGVDRSRVPAEREASRAAAVHSWYSKRYRVSPELAEAVVRHSIRAGVDPEIVFGLIRVESDFDPLAVGREGERGLMQIKVSTALVYERGITPERLFHPEVNLRIGLAHLKREVDHFGNWSLGLLAYNMGRTRLSRMLETGRRPAADYAARVLAGCATDCS